VIKIIAIMLLLCTSTSAQTVVRAHLDGGGATAERAFDRDETTAWCGAGPLTLAFTAPVHPREIDIVYQRPLTKAPPPVEIASEAGTQRLQLPDEEGGPPYVGDLDLGGVATRWLRFTRARGCIAEIVIALDDGSFVLDVPEAALAALESGLRARSLCAAHANSVRIWDVFTPHDYFDLGKSLDQTLRDPARIRGRCHMLFTDPEVPPGIVQGVARATVRLVVHPAGPVYFDFAWRGSRWLLTAIYDGTFE
jgi:hypothetical protein